MVERERNDVPKTRRGIPALTIEEGRLFVAPLVENEATWRARIRGVYQSLTKDGSKTEGIGDFVAGISSLHPPDLHQPMFCTAAAILMGIESRMAIPAVSRNSAQTLLDTIVINTSWGRHLRDVQEEVLTETPGLGAVIEAMFRKYPGLSKNSIFEAAAAVIITIEHQIEVDKAKNTLTDQ